MIKGQDRWNYDASQLLLVTFNIKVQRFRRAAITPAVCLLPTIITNELIWFLLFVHTSNKLRFKYIRQFPHAHPIY